MKAESYTPGHSQNATDFMSRRTVHSHGQFFLSHLISGVSVLDCGCGPGSITLGIAALVAPGRVVGVDFGSGQVERARSGAARAGAGNATFQSADCYSLPFADSSFDRVFSHALMEHLSHPRRATKELYRVLKPGGVIGVCSPTGVVLSWRRRRPRCATRSRRIPRCKAETEATFRSAANSVSICRTAGSKASRCRRDMSVTHRCP